MEESTLLIVQWAPDGRHIGAPNRDTNMTATY